MRTTFVPAHLMADNLIEQIYIVGRNESGEGLPYAPENFPEMGDVWKWRVKTRLSAGGFYIDRFLSPPVLYGGGEFNSMVGVEEYATVFKGADPNEFFASFCYKIPGNEEGLKQLKGRN